MKQITSNSLREILTSLPEAAKNAKVMFSHIYTGFSFNTAACVDTIEGLEMHVGDTAEKTGEITVAALSNLLERLQNSDNEVKVIFCYAGAKLIDDIFEVIYVTEDNEFHERIMHAKNPPGLDIVYPEDAPLDLSGHIDKTIETDGQVVVISF